MWNTIKRAKENKNYVNKMIESLNAKSKLSIDLLKEMDYKQQSIKVQYNPRSELLYTLYLMEENRLVILTKTPTNQEVEFELNPIYKTHIHRYLTNEKENIPCAPQVSDEIQSWVQKKHEQEKQKFAITQAIVDAENIKQKNLKESPMNKINIGLFIGVIICVFLLSLHYFLCANFIAGLVLACATFIELFLLIAITKNKELAFSATNTAIALLALVVSISSLNLNNSVANSNIYIMSQQETIPNGATYIRCVNGEENKLEEGQAFPDVPLNNDRYIYNGETYIYCESIGVWLKVEELGKIDTVN